MRPACEYKDIFGLPGQGVHAVRFLGIAVIDVTLTLLAAWAIAHFAGVPFWLAFASLVLLGILLHRWFCVNTALNVALFGRV